MGKRFRDSEKRQTLFIRSSSQHNEPMPVIRDYVSNASTLENTSKPQQQYNCQSGRNQNLSFYPDICIVSVLLKMLLNKACWCFLPTETILKYPADFLQIFMIHLVDPLLSVPQEKAISGTIMFPEEKEMVKRRRILSTRTLATDKTA